MPTFVLSVPPSANALFFNVKGRGRRKSHKYRAWIAGELKALVAQRARPVRGHVSITITLPKSTRGDASNRVKPAEDLLVRAGIIPDDSGKHVGSVTVTFGDVQMMHVQVEPMAEIGRAA